MLKNIFNDNIKIILIILTKVGILLSSNFKHFIGENKFIKGCFNWSNLK